MKVYREISLRNFEFWSGAVCNASQLTDEEFDELESILESTYSDEISETMINDLFWFDFPLVCSWLGLELDDSENIIREED